MNVKIVPFIGKRIGKYQLIYLTFTDTDTDYQIFDHTDTILIPIIIFKSIPI